MPTPGNLFKYRRLRALGMSHGEAVAHSATTPHPDLASGSGAAALLARFTHNPEPAAHLSQKALAAGAWVPASPANEAALTFTPKGSQVRLVWDSNTWPSASAGYYFGALNLDGTRVAGTSVFVTSQPNSSRRHLERLVPVNSGVETTWVWGQAASAAVTGYPAVGGGDYGPCTFEVWDV